MQQQNTACPSWISGQGVQGLPGMEVILGGIVGIMLQTVAEAIIRHSIKLHPPDSSDETPNSHPISLHGVQDV
jgi:hypothetical protein